MRKVAMGVCLKMGLRVEGRKKNGEGGEGKGRRRVKRGRGGVGGDSTPPAFLTPPAVMASHFPFLSR